VPADGTRAANWGKRGLRYVAVLGQLSGKPLLASTHISGVPDIKAQWRVENLIRGRGFAGVAAGEWAAAAGIAGVSFEKERAQRCVEGGFLPEVQKDDRNLIPLCASATMCVSQVVLEMYIVAWLAVPYRFVLEFVLAQSPVTR